MTNHAMTPGPWEVEPVDGVGIYSSEINSYGNWFVATAARGICDDGPQAVDTDEDKANARAIAAVPDLIAAIEGLFRECAMIHKYGGIADNTKEANAAEEAARAALKKAGVTA